MPPVLILGIDTSCDDTSAAVICDGNTRTYDMGGIDTCSDMGRAIADKL